MRKGAGGLQPPAPLRCAPPECVATGTNMLQVAIACQSPLPGWGYDATLRSPDHSINEYILAGIHEARRAGFNVAARLLWPIHDYYNDNIGRWGYRGARAIPNAAGQGRDEGPRTPTLAMSSAGLQNLLVTSGALR